MRQPQFGAPRGPQGPVGLQSASREQRRVMLRLLRFVMRHYRWSLLVVCLCILLSSVTSLVSSLFTRTLIDDYIAPLLASTAAGAGADYAPLALGLLRLGAVLLLGTACGYLYNRLMIRVSQGTMLRLRKHIFQRMQHLPVAYFDRHSHGELMSVYTNDVDSLRQMISSAMSQVLSSLITIVATFTSMIVLSVPLTLVSILIAALMVYVTGRLGRWSRSYFRTSQESVARVNGFIEEMLSGQRVVKVFCHEEQAIADFETINERLRHAACQASRITSVVMPINGNLGNLGYVLIAVVGAVLALGDFPLLPFQSAVSLGTIVAFLQLNKSFTQPISHVSQEINSVLNATVGAERVFRLADAEPEADEGEQTLENPQGDVDFRHVDFSYVEGKQVLYDIHINTEPGQKIAFVGGTGAGKTTLINLINRFYDIQRGEILYDGIPIVQIDKGSLRRSMAIVLQETHLFTGTVLDNIRYGRLDATDEECVEAARLVGAHEFIRRLASGYNTVLQGDGGNLSQGERQLLAIARAAVANPPVLILDEATSSVDTRTEQMVQRGMDSIMKGRTTFIIAHRLSTVRGADQIIVLDHGRIAEQGTHAQLLALRGQYYQLYTHNGID